MAIGDLAMSATRKKKDNIHIRVEPEQKEVISKAAELLGLDMSAFVLQNSLKAARAELLESERLSLSRSDANLFLDIITNPPVANESLKGAYKTYEEEFNPK